MQTHTDRLSIPLMASAQAQKHVTHNEALARIDDVVQVSVLDASQTAPPATVANGDRFLVATGATGHWLGQDGNLAIWEAASWRFVTLPVGAVLTVLHSKTLLCKTLTGWRGVAIDEVAQLGINTTATAGNRLTVSSDGSLFNHAGASHRLTVNKAASANTACVLFQSDYSGRAEVGLLGDDKLHFKVSSDGAGWTSALTVDSTSGFIGIGTSTPQGPLHILRGATNPLVERIDNTATGSGFEIRKARGATGSPLAVQADDVVQSLYCSAHDGAGYVGCGNMRWVIDGTPGPGNMPTRMEWLTFTPGSGITEKARITSDGRLGIGTKAPTTRLDVAGPIRMGQYDVANVPSAAASGAGALIFIANESGGAVLAFSDGSVWRRATDRAIVS